MKKALIVTILPVLLILTACTQIEQSPVQIVVRDAWIRSATVMQSSSNSNEHGHMNGISSAAYMFINNQSDAPDKLIGANASICETIETHTSKTENGITRMIHVDGIEIPAKSEVELKPGGLHLMLINLQQDLHPGDKVQLEIEFEHSGKITVEAEVRSPQ